MRFLMRPTLCVLLAVLLTMWGACPCVYAQMLDIECAESTAAARSAGAYVPSGALPDGQSPPAACGKACCCTRRVSNDGDPNASDPAGADVPSPGDSDCPCCERGGWIRDLPPQPQAMELAAPLPSAFDVPLGALSDVVLPAAPTIRWCDLGPPTCQRPHATPVGIVCLLN